MESLRKILLTDRSRYSQRLGRAGYFASVVLAGVLLVAGLVVYSHARLRGDAVLPGSWTDYLPMIAMAYGSLLLLAVAVVEVRVRHVRVGVLDRLTAHMTECQEQERNELSARLHDDVGAQLTALKIELEGLGRRSGTDAADWARVDGLLDRILDEVRGLSSLLYPRMIGRVGLKYALQEMADRLCAGTLNVELDVADDVRLLDADRSLCILRVVQEAIINVRRHAKARRIKISLACESGMLKGTVDDDGRGWHHDREGMGLTLMHERVRKAGGTLTSEMSSIGGARIRFDMPIDGSLPNSRRKGRGGRGRQRKPTYTEGGCHEE